MESRTDKEKIDFELLGQEEIDKGTLFDDIRANLAKGNLEEAEEAYIQLWNIFLKQKLKWDKSLYEQLANLSKQFSFVISHSHEDVKTKVNQIYELMNKARTALKEGKKDLPFKLYSEIQKISQSIPSIFFDEKRIIQEQITDFYKELKSTIDKELMNRVSALIQELNRLIDKINNLISSNDMQSASLNYNKCIELYQQIPEGFLRYKNPLGIRILEIYKSLSIYVEISNLQRQLQGYIPQSPKPITNIQQKTNNSEKLSK
ncbi:hypothetical protein HYW99_00125 [Candidatus Woesearchaeota archaeon]|nr:hypothetical protein [Candidatus Woesearchaeota archaeon]